MNFQNIKFFFIFHSVFGWSRRCGNNYPRRPTQATSRTPPLLGLIKRYLKNIHIVLSNVINVLFIEFFLHLLTFLSVKSKHCNKKNEFFRQCLHSHTQNTQSINQAKVLLDWGKNMITDCLKGSLKLNEIWKVKELTYHFCWFNTII